jgi:RNA polymerase sigma-70 factor (ECF subfamily)
MAEELDGDILRRFVQGDREAFERLFRQFERDVFGWVVRIVRDRATAEDVLVEAFWRAYRGRARFDPSRSFGAWMRRIATNVARDYLRASRTLPGGSDTTGRLQAPASADTSVNESVVAAFRTLPPKLQVVATLALVEELPYADIAEALDLPVGTVKSRVFRAVRALRKELASRGIRP